MATATVESGPHSIEEMLALARRHGLAYSGIESQDPDEHPQGLPPTDTSGAQAIDRGIIETALRLLDAGHLTTHRAAVLLSTPAAFSAATLHDNRFDAAHVSNQATRLQGSPLSDDRPATALAATSPESVAQLVERLGPPPEMIVEDWIEQFVDLLTNDAAALAALRADRLTVDQDNRLRPFIAPAISPHEPVSQENDESRSKASSQPTAWDDLSPEMQQAVRAFVAVVDPLRLKVESATATELVTATELAESADKVESTGLAVGSTNNRPGNDASAPQRSAVGLSRRRKQLAVAALLLVVGSGGWFLWQRRLGDADRLATSQPTHSPTTPSQAFQPGFVPDRDMAEPTQRGGDPRVDDGQLSTFESFDSVDEADASSLDSSAVDVSTLLELPATMTPASPLDAASAVNQPANRNETETADITSPEPRNRENGSIDPVEDDPSGMPADELPDSELEKLPDAEVRLVENQSIVLPPLDQPQQSTLVLPIQATGFKLEFPTRNPGIEVAPPAETEQSWSLLSVRPDVSAEPIARLNVGDEGTRWAWTAAASSSSAARQLANGRLQVQTDNGNQTVYLRPATEIDPLPFDFTDQDARTAWPLVAAPDAASSSLHISFQLPKELQLAWIEPPGDQPPRKLVAVAQFTLADDEFVALRMRFDIRAGLRLTCRQRVAARLDSTLPWQTVSLPAVTQFADRLITNQNAAIQMLENLKTVYSAADYRDRQTLRPKRDRLQAQVDAMALATTRLSKLIRLMQLLETGGATQFQLTTNWSDGPQPIVTTAQP